MITDHPNAEVSLYVGAVMVLITWIVSGAAHIDVPDFVWSACTTLLIGFVLFLGKRSRKP